MEMPRMQLNLYLLRSGSSPADAVPSAATPTQGDAGAPSSALEPGDSSGWIRIWTLGVDGVIEGELPAQMTAEPVVLLRATPAATPWRNFLQDLLVDAAVGEEQENLGALLFQAVGASAVVWSFGNAWSLLDPSATVERFGLRTGLNALLSTPAPPSSGKSSPKPVGVRGLTSAIRAAVVRKSTVVTARPASASSLERVDQASDAAAMAELTTHHKTFSRVAAGRSLRFEAPVSSLSDLESYAREALRLHKRDDYKKDPEYQWIDYTVPVTDRAEVDRVLDELLAKASAKSPLPVDIVWVDTDPDTGLTPTFVCFPGERSGPGASHRTDLLWPAARQWLAANASAVPGREALRTKLRFYVAGSTYGPTTVELWQLLVAQLSVGKETFVVSDGEVWRASSSHIADIDARLGPRTVINPSWLPKYKPGEVEGAYNARAALLGGHFLLDKSLVRIPGQTTFEPCDLMSGDGHLMHVKRKTSSSTMSHVVAQALTSTQLLRSDVRARDLLDAALLSATPRPLHLSDMRDHVASLSGRFTGVVDVVILGQWRGTPDIAQLPLLTRITLNGWLQQMPTDSQLVLVGT
jgi:uncharacterized protein (TIGR04141 family)